MKCSRCGHDNPLSSRFCNECGAPLETSPARAAHPSTPQHLSEKILTSRGALLGERKQVTVLFADLKASMELLADRDPEEARAVLDAVLERMMDAVHHYEGTVNQVMGDGIMALFGAPLAHEDHAVRACYAALRMQESVGRYADELQRTMGLVVRIRVGLNSGEVVVRSIGNDLRMDYTAVGQTTHLAARMEQIAQPGSILITHSTLRLADRAITVQALGRRLVKGLDAPVDVYEVVGGVPIRSIDKTTAAQRQSPFVGRDAELAKLVLLATEARQGQTRVVGVSGEPGVGKTRLLYEFLQSPEVRDWQVMECRSLSYERSTVWAPVIELLRRYFQLDGRETAAEIAVKVSLKGLTLDEPILALLEALPEQDAWHGLDAPERRRRVIDALTRLVLKESEHRPLILLFENLQWLDTETHALIENLVERVSSAPLMLLLDYRPEFAHGWAAQPRFSEIVLAPLSRKTVEELLDTILLGDRALADLKKLIADRSRGNPFFLEEIFRTLLETRALVHEPGIYRLTGDLATLDVPATVQALIAARIDRLVFDEKLVLQSAAIIGSDVPAALLAALTELPSERLHATLATLVTAGFLEQTALYPDLEYRFLSPLTRDVASASLLREQRRALHARTVEVMETLYAERLSGWIDQLAEHASLAALWPKAFVYNRRSAARAAAHAANVHAVRAYEATLQALARLPSTRETIEHSIDVRVELLAPLLQRGRLDKLLAVAREAEGLAREIGDDRRLARVSAYLVNYHYLKGEAELAIDYGEKCLEIARVTGDVALEALARQYIGQSHHLRGDHVAAERALRANLELDLDRNGTLYIASCGWLAWSLADRGEFDEAQAYVERARRAAEDSGHAYSQAIAWTMAGLVALRSGHHARAVLPLGRSLETTQRNELGVWQPIPSSLLGLAFVRLGHVAEGLRLLQDSVVSTSRLGVRAYNALWTLNLAEGYLANGQHDRAAGTAHEALSLAEAGGERGHAAYAHQLLGEIAARRSPPELETAKASYTTALQLALRLGLRPLTISAQHGLDSLHERGEDADERVSALNRLLIVANSNTALYEFFAKELAASPAIAVIADRRQAERRIARHEIFEERRRDQRRQGQVDEDLRAWQVSVALRAS